MITCTPGRSALLCYFVTLLYDSLNPERQRMFNVFYKHNAIMGWYGHRNMYARTMACKHLWFLYPSWDGSLHAQNPWTQPDFILCITSDVLDVVYWSNHNCHLSKVNAWGQGVSKAVRACWIYTMCEQWTNDTCYLYHGMRDACSHITHTSSPTRKLDAFVGIGTYE